MEHIFICYRREDSADVAGRIYDRLKDHFGVDVIFKDVDKMPFGVDFRRHLDGKVSECSAFLAVIGRNWLDSVNDKGTPRLADPTDYVRVELESALKRDIPVIPLLVHGTLMPSIEELPEPLRDLSYRNAVSVRPDPDFHNDMDRLINGLELQLGIARATPVAARLPADDGLSQHGDMPSERTARDPEAQGTGLRKPTTARGRVVALVIACLLLAAAFGYWAVDRHFPNGQSVAQGADALQLAAEAERKRQELDARQAAEARAEAERQRQELEARQADEARAEEERNRRELETRQAAEARAEAERQRQELEARRADEARAEEERNRRELEARQAEEARAEAERKRQELEARQAQQAGAEEERKRRETEQAARDKEARLARARAEQEAKRARLVEERSLAQEKAAAERERLRIARIREDEERVRAEERARKAAQVVRLALFPHEELPPCFHPVSGRMKGAAAQASATRPNVELAYSWYESGPTPPGLGPASRIWGGNVANRYPAVAEVQAISRRLNVNAVLMGWYECSSSSNVDDFHYKVVLYLVDVTSGKVFEERTGLYNTEAALRRLMDQLVADRG